MASFDAVSTTRPVSTRPARLGLSGAWREALLGYALVLPALTILVVFGLYPVLRAAYMSLHNWSIIKGAYVGLNNYRQLLGDGDFWKALQVTVFYVIATVPLTMLFSLLLAYLLFRPLKMRSFFRTLYFLPYITSMVPAAMVWQWIFNFQSGVLNYIAEGLSRGVVAPVLRVAGDAPTVYLWLGLSLAWVAYLVATRARRTGLMTGFLLSLAGLSGLLSLAFALWPGVLENTVREFETFFPVRWMQEPRGIFLYLGKKWGFTPPRWLHGPSMALMAVSMVSMWHFIGYDVVIYLAGLFNVPPELHEAARIDGASEGQIFWKITFPLLSPTTFFLLIISTIGAFRAFTMFYVMTSGGPLRTTTSITYYIYDRFYTAGRWGYASSIALVLFVIILAMTLLNQRLAGRRVVYQ